MKLFGINLSLGRKPPLWSRSPLDDPKAAAKQFAEINYDPSVVKMNAVNLADGAPTLADVRRFASILVERRTSKTERFLPELLLGSAIGDKLAKAVLSRDTLRERWNTVLEIADHDPAARSIARGDALRLSRELMSPQAQALRSLITSTSTGYVQFIAENAPDLSEQAIELCVRQSNSNFYTDNAIKELRLQHALRAVFQAVGETLIRPLSVKELLGDNALLFDAFERFIEANDRGLGTLAAMTDAMNSALEGKGDIAAHTGGRSLADLTERLRGDVNHMVEWHAALYGNKDSKTLQTTADALLTRLSTIADEVSAALATRPALNGGTTDLATAPAFVKDPCSRLLEVCSKSKPEVEVATIATVEELIRVLHREAARGFGQLVQSVIAAGGDARSYNEELASASGGMSKATLTVASKQTPEDFKQSPMGAVADVFGRYIKGSANGKMRIPSAVITDSSFNFDVELGCHSGRLAVTYDYSQKKYALVWGMQEPESSDRRMRFCNELFPLIGFKHTMKGWKHSATRTANADELPKALAFLLFSLENMKDLDLRAGRYNPAELLKVFDSWYAKFAMGEVVGREQLASCALEERIAKLAEHDTHFFRMGALLAKREGRAGSESIVTKTALAFVTSHTETLFDARPDTVTLTRAIAAAARACERQWQQPDADLLHEWKAPEPMTDDRLKATSENAARAVVLGGDGKVSPWTYEKASELVGPVYQSTR